MTESQEVERREARGYSWQPFGKGHELSVRHGAYSQRRIDPVAVELASGLVADRPDLEGFPEAVMAWARAEARCLLVADWLAEHGLVDDDGKPAGVAKHVASWERLALDARARLGLDPMAAAALERERAQAVRERLDLDGIAARGREALARRQAALVTTTTDTTEKRE